MKLYKYFFLLMFLSGQSHASICTPDKNSCELYKCLEEEKNCGKDGFLIKTGYEFCHNFKSIENIISSDGYYWLRNVRQCLQEKLLEMSHLDCNEFENRSVKDHVDCYLEFDYCGLPIRDKANIYRLLLQELIDAPKYIIKNMFEMLRRGCL